VRAWHPELPAQSLDLRDLLEIIYKAKIAKNIKAMAYDSFLLQP
jgi:hypothetical protein